MKTMNENKNQSEKLTLEYLAPYLPYGLKMYNPKSGQTVKIIGLSESKKGINLIIDLNNSGYNIGTFLPILKPLKDYKIKFDRYFKQNYSSFEYFCQTANDGEMPHYQLIDLIVCSFDVFGLIEKGLAIDINTLKP